MVNYSDPTLYIILTASWIIILSFFVIVFPPSKCKSKNCKKVLFLLFIIPVLLSTLYLGGHTVYKNIHSETKGPVHWHADFRVWVCGEELDLINPTGLRNKVGNPLFHEHDDNRVHVEGTVDDISNVDFERFFKVIGGELTNSELVFPTEDKGRVEVSNGDLCSDLPGELAIYVNGVRIKDVQNYMYYPHPLVPPGDCVIVEFGVDLPNKTDRICNSWAAKGWTYENYKELRKEYAPWGSDDWVYDEQKGYGVVE